MPLTLALLLVLAGVGRAAAPTPALHAHLLRSVPAAGDTLRARPSELRLEFSEPIEPALSAIRLLGPGGLELDLTARDDPDDVRALRAALPRLESGGYRVAWRIVSADGHPVAGDYAFYVLLPAASDSAAVALEPPPPAPSPETTSPAAQSSRPPIGLIALRWASLTALLAFAGLLAFVPAASAGGRLVVALAVLTPFLLAAHLAAWAAFAAPGSGIGVAFGPALRTDSGRLDALRVVCALLALWAVALARRPGIALGFALAAVIASAGIGHALGTAPAVALPAKAVHLVATALWLGGLVAIARSPSEGPDPRLARRVSGIALVAVVVIAATGVLQALVLLPDLAALVNSIYGRILLAKIAGLLVLLGFGAYHRLRLLPRLEQGAAGGRLRGSVRREVLVVLAVALVAAVLAHVPPPDYTGAP